MLLAAVPEPGAAAETRVALVIGNGAYQHAPALANPANDARAVAAALRRLDFTVEEEEDLDIADTRAALGRFADLLQDADVGLVFYAGHSLQVRNENYLVPVDAKLDREIDLDLEAVGLDVLLRLLDARQRTNLVFLDACRDNPFARSLARSLGETRSQSVGVGLARIEAGIGTLIAYATQPGNVASDGQGDHSPFTAALLANLETPGLEVGQMLRRVRKTVIERTAHQQVPWDHSSLTGDFYFKPPEPSAAAPTSPAGGDMAVWKAIEDSTEPEDFSTFIAQYPDSLLVPFARTRIAAIRGQKPDETASRPATPEPASDALKPGIEPEPMSAPTPPDPRAAVPEPEPPMQTAVLAQDTPYLKAASEAPIPKPVEAQELALGWSRDDWRGVQRALNALDYPVGPTDGLVGRQTRSGVTAWQLASGAEPTGYLTGLQRAHLLRQAESQLAALRTAGPDEVSRRSEVPEEKSTRSIDRCQTASAALNKPHGATFDLVRVSLDQYQQAFDAIMSLGYRPSDITIMPSADGPCISVLWINDDSKNKRWVARHGLDDQRLAAEDAKWKAQGFRIVDKEQYRVAGRTLWAAIWLPQ